MKSSVPWRSSIRDCPVAAMGPHDQRCRCVYSNAGECLQLWPSVKTPRARAREFGTVATCEPNEQKNAANDHSAARQRHVWYSHHLASLWRVPCKSKTQSLWLRERTVELVARSSDALLERGARRIYAAGRDLETLEAVVRLDPQRIRALKLDVTRADERAPRPLRRKTSRC